MKYFVECCGCDYRNGKTKGVICMIKKKAKV